MKNIFIIHFDGYHRIYQIPELIDLINKIV